MPTAIPPAPTSQLVAPAVWLAHVLSLSRVPLVIGFWAVYPRPLWSAAVIAAAAITDALDGWTARRACPGGSATGGWLDPLADKIFVVGALAAIYVDARPPLGLIALIAARELVLVPLMAGYLIAGRRRVRPVLRAAPLGKAATVAQLAALLALIAGSPAAWALAGLAAATGLAACVQYVARATRP
ncbi:MAG TPA: CDP-alcohol phosphatidyltransferase family protein [Kofleriaceae bacterium]|nr:CDP-alcohol phosphatidyltransferase family protein [Kofleriaceae bacterium]